MSNKAHEQNDRIIKGAELTDIIHHLPDPEPETNEEE